MKSKILKMLREQEKFISGQEICDSLGISRTAVWKYMNQLKGEGYEIESVSNKGYHLTALPDIISVQEVQSQLSTIAFGQEMYFFDEIDSTNNYIKKIAENGASHGSLAIAECQTGGKGRRGRVWKSPKGSGIWMSYLLRPTIPPYSASMLTLVAGLAVAKVLSEVSGMEAKIKWPNDIVINSRKVCGILTEMSADPDMINYVVVGIGINVNTKEFPEDIAQTATSLRIEMGSQANRSSIIAKICKVFENYYEKFCRTCDMTELIDEYNKHLVNVDREVRISELDGEYTGVAKGIDKDGQLLVEMSDGSVKAVFAGEVSVRGLYGYV